MTRKSHTDYKLKQKKPASSFSLLSFFSSRNSKAATPQPSRRPVEDSGDHIVKAYKVYPSDEDRGRWVAEPGIDRKASAYISLTTNKWEKLAMHGSDMEDNNY